MALVAGLVGTVTQARHATQQAVFAESQRERADQLARVASEQRDFALRQLSRAEAISDLNTFVLSDAAPSGSPFTVDDLLARAERIVEKQYGESDENRVETLVAIGRQRQTLEEDAKARKLFEKAYALAENIADRSTRAKAACGLAGAIAIDGEFGRADQLIQDTLNDLPHEPQFALARIFCQLRGSYAARESGDPQMGIERALAAQHLVKESNLGSAVLDLRVFMDLAESYRMAGRNREASAAFADAHARLRSLGRDDTETAGTLLNNWALAVRSLGQPLEAERLFRQAIEISRADRTVDRVSPMLLNNVARVLVELARFQEAAQNAERAYAKASSAGNEVAVNQSLLMRAAIYRSVGDLDRAATVLREVEPRLKRMLPAGHYALGVLVSEHALLAELGRDFRAAKAAADDAIAIVEAARQGMEFLPTLLVRRSNIELQIGRSEQAIADAARALEMERSAVGEGALSSRIGHAYLALGRALQARARLAEAGTAFASALEHLEPTLGANHPDTREADASEMTFDAQGSIRTALPPVTFWPEPCRSV